MTPPPPSARRRNPRNTGRFDRAVVLFNAQAYFEAHEDWEELWHEAEGAERRWLQGLIQLAAAFVHFARGRHARGFVKLMREGRAKREGYGGDDWGLDLARLEHDVLPWLEHARRVDRGGALLENAPPRVHLHYRPGVEPEPLPLEGAEDEV